METTEKSPAAESSHRGPISDEMELQNRRGESGSSSLAGDLLKGALAGAVGVVVLDRVTSMMWNRESPGVRERERRARPAGLDPAHAIAGWIAGAMGRKLSPAQPHPAGIAVHYGLGILPGAIYGALRRRIPGVGAAAGMGYGLALFLMEDEGLNPILGTSGQPAEYPWQAHARGLVGHLVLGMVTHSVIDILDRVLKPMAYR